MAYIHDIPQLIVIIIDDDNFLTLIFSLRIFLIHCLLMREYFAASNHLN